MRLHRNICIGATLALAAAGACERPQSTSSNASASPAATASPAASASPAAPAAPALPEMAAEQQGYVMVAVSEPARGPKLTTRTYLLARHALVYSADSKLMTVFDLEDESWVSRSGKTTLAYAEDFHERSAKLAEQRLPNSAAHRASLQRVLRPTFSVTEADGLVTLRNSRGVYQATPVSPPLPDDVADRVYRLRRMRAYALSLAAGGDVYQPYDELALAEELRKRSICPASDVRTTTGRGSPPSQVRRTFSYEPLSPQQYARLEELARQFEAQSLSAARD